MKKKIIIETIKESKIVKLNIGCSTKHIKGYENIDLDPRCKPDKIMDITKRWTYEDNSVDEVLTSHILEHLMCDMEFLANEVMRVLKVGGIWHIKVPYCNYILTYRANHVKFYSESLIHDLLNHHAHLDFKVNGTFKIENLTLVPPPNKWIKLIPFREKLRWVLFGMVKEIDCKLVKASNEYKHPLLDKKETQ